MTSTEINNAVASAEQAANTLRTKMHQLYKHYATIKQGRTAADNAATKYILDLLSDAQQIESRLALLHVGE